MIKREVLALVVFLALSLSASATSNFNPQAKSAKSKANPTQSKTNPSQSDAAPSSDAQHDTKNEPLSESARRAQQLLALVDSPDADRAVKIKRALSDDDWYMRGEAALALSMLRDQAAVKDAVPELSRLTKDQSWFVRNAALQALSGSGDPSAVQAVLGLLDPSDPYACSEAAVLIGKLSYAPAQDSLLKLLTDENDAVRASSAEALGRLKDQRAVDPLMSLLKDEMPSVRLSAAVALGSIGDPRAAAAIEAALKDSADDQWQYSIALYRLKNHDHLGEVVAALKSPYADTRDGALAALTELADARSLPALVELGNPAKSRAVIDSSTAGAGSGADAARRPELEAASLRYKIAGALGRFDNDDARSALVSMFADPQPEVRAAAVASLASSAGRPKGGGSSTGTNHPSPTAERASVALRPLVDLLKKEQTPLVYSAILESFSSFDRDQTVDALLAALDASGNRDANIRRALTEIGITSDLMTRKLTTGNAAERIRAADALSRLGDRQAVPLLIDGLSGAKEPEVKASFAKALGTLGDRRAMDALTVASKSPDGQVRVAALTALGRLGDHTASDILLVATKDDQEVVREAAFHSLSLLGISVERLTADVANPSWQTRIGALSMLAKLGDRRAVPVAITALKDKDERVRAESARTLGVLADARAVDPLVESLHDPNPEVRFQSATALGVLKEGRALAPLTASLSDRDSRVSAAAAESLARMQDPRAIRLLVDSLASPDWRLRARAAQVLSRVPAAASAGGAIQPLGRALRDSDLVVRYYAGEALVAVGADGVPPVLELMRSAKFSERQRAARVLGRIGVPAVEGLIGLVQDRTSLPESKAEAAGVLGAIGDPRAVAPLLELLRDQRYFVRQQASQALGRIGGPAIDNLIEMARSSLPATREAAIEALGAVAEPAEPDPAPNGGSGSAEPSPGLGAASPSSGVTSLALGGASPSLGSARSFNAPGISAANQSRAIDGILNALNDSNGSVRSAAVRALGETGNRRAVEPLMALLHDEASTLRGQAATSLAKLGQVALPALIGALRDPRPSVRVFAAHALGEIGSKEAVPALTEVVASDSSAARGEAVEALGRIGDAKAVDAILSALRSGSPAVRRRSALALAHIQEPRVMNALVAALADKDEETRQAAATGLGEVGDARAVSSLEKVLETEASAEVRSAAVAAIERIQSRNAPRKGKE